MRVFTRFAGRALAAATSLVLAGGVLAGAAAPAGADPGAWTWDAPGWGYSYDDEYLGDIWYTSPHGEFLVLGDDWGFVAAHGALGGGRGALGYPTRDVVEQHLGGLDYGYYQVFEGGVVYDSAAGTFAVLDGSPTGRVHRAHGGGGGTLGYPAGDPVQQAPGWWYQQFTEGYAYAGPRGAYAVVGLADYVHRAEGGGGGIGYPVEDPRWDAPSFSYQRFERGIIYCNPSRFGPQTCSAVKGGFVGAHGSQGGGRGRLGYPEANEVFSPAQGTPSGYWSQSFQGGRIRIATTGQITYTQR